MGTGAVIGLNGSEVEAYAVELVDGFRMRLSVDDWEHLRVHRGQRVPVRMPGRDDVWLFVVEVVELPPIVWVVLARRVRE